MTLGPTAAVGSLSLPGCVIPPPGEVVRDAGTPNSPPVVIGASPPEFAFPGPVTIPTIEPPSVTLTFSDNDVDDTLYVRKFRDYDLGAPSADVTCGGDVIPPTGAVERQAEFCTGTWCPASDDGTPHMLEVVVADRPFIDDGMPLFRGLPEGAGSSVRAWRFLCTQ
jgi:hypothetical protein